MTDAMVISSHLRRPASRQDRVQAFLRNSVVGLLAFAIVTAVFLLKISGLDLKRLGGPIVVILVGAAVVLLLSSIVQLYRFRKSDEFVFGMWNAATSAAFIAFLFLGLFHLLVAFAADVFAPARRLLDWMHEADLSTLVVPLAFFVALNLQRWRAER